MATPDLGPVGTPYTSQHPELTPLLNELHWLLVSTLRPLTEAFIETHAAELDWRCLALYQTLSEDFIVKHLDRLDPACLLANAKLSLSEPLRVVLTLARGSLG